MGFGEVEDALAIGALIEVLETRELVALEIVAVALEAATTRPSSSRVTFESAAVIVRVTLTAVKSKACPSTIEV